MSAASSPLNIFQIQGVRMQELPVVFKTVDLRNLPDEVRSGHQLVASLTTMPVGGVIATTMLEDVIVSGRAKAKDYLSAQRVLMQLAAWVGTHGTFSPADIRFLGAALLSLSSFATTARVPLAFFERDGLKEGATQTKNKDNSEADNPDKVYIPLSSQFAKSYFDLIADRPEE